MENNTDIETALLAGVEVVNLNFEQLQERLAELKPELDRVTKLRREYDILREALQLEMQQRGTARTIPVNGYYSVLAERVTPVVTDEVAVLEWLAENVDEPREYLKLNLEKVIALAEHELNATGEIIPGLGTQTSNYISVKRAK